MELDPYGDTNTLGMISPFFTRGWLTFWLLVSVWYFGAFFGWKVFILTGDRPMYPQFQRSTFLYGCQLHTDFHNTCNVKCFKCLVLVCLGQFTEWCAVNHSVCLHERSWPFRCSSVCVSHFTQCIGVWTLGKDCSDRLQCSCSVGIGGSVLSVLPQFLSNRSQQVVVAG